MPQSKHHTNYQAIVVPHTHWDREWYLTVDETRPRLVQLIERVLSIIRTEPEYPGFWLDGQTIPVEDVLEVRPQLREELTAALKAGKILIGPWYVLSDEFLVHGESLIRNLFVGRKAMQAVGQDNRIGYAPDTFGHISQFPQILAGFGIDNAVFWRGIRKEELDACETRWEAPDGTAVLAICLIEGYSNAGDLSLGTVEQSAGALDRSLPGLKSYSSTGRLLLLNGRDHALPARRMTEILAKLQNKFPEVSFRLGSISEYLKAVRHQLGKGLQSATTFRGELRHAPQLDGCLSSRIGQKLANRRIENLLIHYADPLAAIAHTMGKPVPDGFLQAAWKPLLQNHAHDSICSPHSDAVAKAVADRFRRAEEVASAIVVEAMQNIVGQVPKEMDVQLPTGLVVFNPCPWPRDEVIEVTMDLPPELNVGALTLSQNGRELPTEVLSQTTYTRLTFGEYRKFTATQEDVQRFRLLIKPDLDSLSFQRLEVKVEELGHIEIMDATGDDVRVKARAEGRMVTGSEVLDNGLLRVRMAPDGRLDITELRTGRTLRNLNALFDREDTGDLYQTRRPLDTHTTAPEPGAISIVENSALRGALCTRTTITAGGTVCPLSVTVSLAHGDTHVTIQVRMDNRGDWHRLEARFPLPEELRTVHAHMPFDLVSRKPTPPEEYFVGSDVAFSNAICQPMHTAVIASGSSGTLTLLSRGLYEFTWLNEDTLALTLLRATGRIRKELQMFPAEGGQCHGEHVLTYGIGLSPESDVLPALKTGTDFNLRPYAMQVFGDAAGPGGSMVELTNPHWILSALKLAEEENGIVVRFWNASEVPQSGTVRLGLPYTKAYRTRMDETLLQPLPEVLTARPKEIVTLLYRLEQVKGCTEESAVNAE